VNSLPLRLADISLGAGARPAIFIEGITTDSDGNLYIVDVPYGRILRTRIEDLDDWELVVEYDGEPNGLAIREDGMLVIADYKQGMVRG
jgi:gluconolactonase